ncbi:MAG: radical SAM protein, partial [Proteobacteria bacterium]|nr:radical SAM protein [Pseudomonadota bacterium]
MTNNPSSEDSCKICLVTFHSGFSHSSLALPSIKAYCSEEIYYPGISIHEPLINAKIDPLIKEIVEIGPKIIGFSTYLWNIQLTLRVGDILKKLLPDSILIFGGPEAGARGEELLSKYRWLDYVIEGEGEIAFRNLVNSIFSNTPKIEEIHGLTRRDKHNNVISKTPSLAPLDSLHSPFKQGLISGDKNLVYLETSRGCPFRCRFCTSADEKPRTFPLERIKNDLNLISQMD